MKSKNPVQEKSYSFALNIVRLYRFLCAEEKEYILSKQLVRSGTSIGANIEEAIGGNSEKDFQYKMNLAYKEARETHYGLKLMRDSNISSREEFEPLIADCEELLRLTGSIIKTLKNKNS